MNKLLNDYFKLLAKVHEAFGYKEDWCVFPMVDERESYWRIEGTESDGTVVYADSEEALSDEGAGDYYTAPIYTQRFLPKWVYQTEEYTMILIDTQTDGNKYLAIFDNKKRIS